MRKNNIITFGLLACFLYSGLTPASEGNVFSIRGLEILGQFKKIEQSLNETKPKQEALNAQLAAFDKCTAAKLKKDSDIANCLQEGVVATKLAESSARHLKNLAKQIEALPGYQDSTRYKELNKKIQSSIDRTDVLRQNLASHTQSYSAYLLKALSSESSNAFDRGYQKEQDRLTCELFPTKSALWIAKSVSDFQTAERKGQTYLAQRAQRVMFGIKNLAVLNSAVCKMNFKTIEDTASNHFESMSKSLASLRQTIVASDPCRNISKAARTQLDQPCREIPMTDDFLFWLQTVKGN